MVIYKGNTAKCSWDIVIVGVYDTVVGIYVMIVGVYVKIVGVYVCYKTVQMYFSTKCS